MNSKLPQPPCICYHRSGISRRPAGDQNGCPRHGHIPLSDGKLKLIEKALAEVETFSTELSGGDTNMRWGTCYENGVPENIEWRKSDGRGDFGPVVVFDQRWPPERSVAELIGLLDPPTVREILRRATTNHETAYRRGYIHGYSKAMDDLESGCAKSLWDKVCTFFDDVLTPWRYHKDQKSMLLPPCFKDKSEHIEP